MRRTGRAARAAALGRHPRQAGVCRQRDKRGGRPSHSDERIAMVMFWVTLLAVGILIYVLLDGFDLGIGMLFSMASDEPRRRAMMSAVAPIWDGNETWLVVSGVILWGAFPVVYSILMSAFYLPVLLMLAGLILRGVSFEFRS